MPGQLEQMIAYQKAHPKLEEMAHERAMEMMARKPNMRRKVNFLNTIAAEKEGLKSGGAKGLQRVVGGAKKMAKAEEMAKKYFEDDSDTESTDSKCEEKEKMEGGFLPMLAAAAIPLLGNLFGSGKKLSKGSAYGYGRHMGAELEKLHGAGFLGDFIKGIASIFGAGQAGAGLSGGCDSCEGGAESVTKSYAKGVAVRRSVPGAIDGTAQQGPDYAPRWFRNSGDIAGGAAPKRGRPRKAAAAMPAAPAAKAKKPRMLSDRQRQRNAMISKLTREKGMSLPEASRYIKEHGLV